MNPEAIGVESWELMIDTQVHLLELISEIVGYDVIELAQALER